MPRNPTRKRELKIEGAFVPHRQDMLASEAWAELSIVDRRVLDRLELEHMSHAGTENGNLPCTFDDFAAFGIRRQSIGASLKRLHRLGLVRITEQGRGGNAEWRKASRYRLTYIGAKGEPPTDDWRRYRSVPAKAPHAGRDERSESAVADA